MELTAQNVRQTFEACLFQPGEDTTRNVEARAARTWVKFHPERLAAHQADVVALLGQLPEQFRADHIARGASFLLACERQDGQLWGEHQDIDWLLALGLAIGRVHLTHPRELWPQLTGGVPHFSLDLPK